MGEPAKPIRDSTVPPRWSLRRVVADPQVQQERPAGRRRAERHRTAVAVDRRRRRHHLQLL